MKRIYIRLISYFDKREEEKPAAPMPEDNDSCEFEASIERRAKAPVYTVFLASQGGEYLSHNDPPSAVPVGEDCANASSHESTIPDESMADEWEEIAAADVEMTIENLPPVMLDTVHTHETAPRCQEIRTNGSRGPGRRAERLFIKSSYTA